jgi:transcription elongation factor Elf1
MRPRLSIQVEEKEGGKIMISRHYCGVGRNTKLRVTDEEHQRKSHLLEIVTPGKCLTCGNRHYRTRVDRKQNVYHLICIKCGSVVLDANTF